MIHGFLRIIQCLVHKHFVLVSSLVLTSIAFFFFYCGCCGVRESNLGAKVEQAPSHRGWTQHTEWWQCPLTAPGMERDDPGPEAIQGVQLGATGVMARDRTGTCLRRRQGDIQDTRPGSGPSIRSSSQGERVLGWAMKACQCPKGCYTRNTSFICFMRLNTELE